MRLSERQKRKPSPIKKNELAVKLNPETWFRQFTRITFLGRPLKDGQYVHIEMAKLLKTIEGEFIRMLGSGSAEKTGDILLNNSKEGISGSRKPSSTATFSMHMFGLAVDVNYLGNPYIESDNDIIALNNVLKNAALLMNTEVLTYEKGTSGKFKDRFDYVKALDAVLENYFKLLDNPSELARYLRNSRSSGWRGLSLTEAKTKIQRNPDNLPGLLARGGNYKDYFKKNAILNFDKRFVAGMEAMGLHWGGHYGDMMHFDMRRTGVGYYIEKARIAYSKKVQEQAKYLLKEKKYGEHTPDRYFQNIGQRVMAHEKSGNRQVY